MKKIDSRARIQTDRLVLITVSGNYKWGGRIEIGLWIKISRQALGFGTETVGTLLDFAGKTYPLTTEVLHLIE